jgi:integrase
MAQITTNGLRAKWSGKDRWLSDGGSRGAGRLVARITSSGAFFFFQYFSTKGCRRLFPMGRFDVQGTRGLSLIAARARCAELSALYRSGTKDIHAHFEQQQRQTTLAREVEAEAAAQARADAQRYSLKRFLTAYVEHLQRLGKPSAHDVQNIFKNHVFADAILPDIEASVVETDEFVRIIGKVVVAGHGRTAGKLRSYLHAAYGLAIRSKTDPAAPQVMREFAIKVNPISSIHTLSQYNNAQDRHLSAPELAAFLRRVRAKPLDAKRDALGVCIELGEQRPTRLLRLRRADVDLSARVLTLYDVKGKRQKPRLHVVPLTKHAVQILERRISNLTSNEPVFSTNARTAVDRATLTHYVAAISREMLNTREVHEPFTCAISGVRWRRCWLAGASQAMRESTSSLMA